MELCVSTSLLCLLLFGTPIIGGTVQTSDKTLPERVPRIIADKGCGCQPGPLNLPV